MKTILKALFFAFILIGSTLAFADNVEEGNNLYNAGKYHEALTYLMKPDANIDPKGMTLIGYMYNRGLGVEKDSEEAFKWYQKAAGTGLSVAQFNLGIMYENGKGTKKDIAKLSNGFGKQQNKTILPLK